jgi:hypothetical protein
LVPGGRCGSADWQSVVMIKAATNSFMGIR